MLPVRWWWLALAILVGALALSAGGARGTALRSGALSLDLRHGAVLTVHGLPPTDLRYSVADVGDVNGSGRDAIAIGVGGASRDGKQDTGAVWVIFPPANGGTIDVRKPGWPGFLIRGAGTSYDPNAHDDPDNDFAGARVVAVGDVNGDGLADIAIAAPYASYFGRQYSGAVYVVFGRRSGKTVDLGNLGSGGYVAVGPQGSELGYSLAGAGDVNGDGLPDLIAGAPGAYTPDQRGSAWVIYGRNAPGIVDLTQPGNGYEITGGPSSVGMGTAVAGLGDINGDGIPDVAVSQPYDSSGQPGSRGGDGVVNVVYGHQGDQAVQLDQLGGDGFRIQGTRGDLLGASLAGPGDVNGDGIPDILIGAPGQPQSGVAGRAYVVFGARRTGTLSLAHLGPAGIVMRGERGDLAGFSVAAIGDVNHDGLADFAVGAPWASPNCRPAAGAVYVVHGRRAAGSIQLARFGAAGIIDGAQPVDEAGSAIASAGDLYGHHPDLLIASPAEDAGLPVIHGHAQFDWSTTVVPTGRVPLSRPVAQPTCITLHPIPTTLPEVLHTGRLRVRVTMRERYRMGTSIRLAVLPSHDFLAYTGTPLSWRPGTGPVTSTVTFALDRRAHRLLVRQRPSRLYVEADEYASAGGGCCSQHNSARITLQLR